jgi:hypothetical protein
MLGITFLHHLAGYALPRKIIPYVALPWAFRLDYNLDLDIQTVTYAAVHDLRIARWSHLTLPLEQVAWAIILRSLHPAALVAALVVVTVQALLLGEGPLAGILVATWAVFAGVAALGLQAFGTAAVVASILLLLVGPVRRFIGHAFEPVPPFVGKPKEGAPRDEFLPLSRTRLGLTVPLLGFGGIVSEFAAGFPYRLIVVQVYWLAQQLGFRPRKASAEARARELGAVIRANGWKAYGNTRQLLVPEAPPVAPSSAPEVDG